MEKSLKKSQQVLEKISVESFERNFWRNLDVRFLGENSARNLEGTPDSLEESLKKFVEDFPIDFYYRNSNAILVDIPERILEGIAEEIIGSLAEEILGGIAEESLSELQV